MFQEYFKKGDGIRYNNLLRAEKEIPNLFGTIEDRTGEDSDCFLARSGTGQAFGC